VGLRIQTTANFVACVIFSFPKYLPKRGKEGRALTNYFGEALSFHPFPKTSAKGAKSSKLSTLGQKR